jgi:hypothetical protein
MKSLHRDLPVKDFEYESGGLESREICPISHQIANNYCPNPYREIFLLGIVPENCAVHTTTANLDTSNVLKYFGTPPNTSVNNGLMF